MNIQIVQVLMILNIIIKYPGQKKTLFFDFQKELGTNIFVMFCCRPFSGLSFGYPAKKVV